MNKLESALKSLGLPVGLVALFAAVLGLFGVDLEVILNIAYGMVGAYALVSVLVDVLKWAGVVPEDQAGKFSAAGHLLIIIAVGVGYGLFPDFDYQALDADITEFLNMAALAAAWSVQVIGSKWFHYFVVDVLGIKAVSGSNSYVAWLENHINELQERLMQYDHADIASAEE